MPLSVHALCEYKDVVAYLAGKEQIPDEHRVMFELLINGISASIERYCNRHFEIQTLTDETYTGLGRQKLMLANRPVISVSSVKINITGMQGGAGLVVTDYSIDANAGMLYRLVGWPSGRQEQLATLVAGEPSPHAVLRNILVSYVSGYQTPASPVTNGAGLVPDDLKLAAIELTVRRYKLRDKVGPKESFQTSATEYEWWPPYIKATLDDYYEFTDGSV